MTKKIIHLKLMDIAPVEWIELQGKIHHIGQFRDLTWHESLHKILPSISALSINIGYLKPDHTMPLHENLFPHLLLFISGSGKFIGENSYTKIKEGDTVLIPAGQSHSFIAGPKGLHSVCIQLGNEFYQDTYTTAKTNSKQKLILTQTLKKNQKYINQFYSNLLFKKIKSGLLNNLKKREIFSNAIQIWFNKCQEPFLSRQTIEEKSFDLTLESLAEWFIYQTLILDQMEKIAINHLITKPVTNLFINICESYEITNIKFPTTFNLIKTNLNDEQPLLIENLHTAKRINEVLEESWKMVDAFSSRVYSLMDKEKKYE